MKGQELKVLFKHDKAYLTKDKPMTFLQLGLPTIAKSFKTPAYWSICVLNYIETERKIYCEIISYHTEETGFPEYPKNLLDKLNHLEIVTFKSIDTIGLLRTLNGTEGTFTPVPHVPVVRTEYIQNIKKPPIKTINETFFVPLKNVHFILGGVSFHKKFNAHNLNLELTIANNNIREEFDAVKNYFGNVLGARKIAVTAIIEIQDDNIISAQVNSPEISRIDEKLIDNVKFEFVKSTIKKKINVELERSLFTMEEYFDAFAEEKFNPNTFHSNAKELFEDLLAITDTKHYKHLRYLSSKHSHETMKLRFVHKPFSFIFLIKGNNHFHIIWETLDTEEATYVWHINKDISILKLTLKKIEYIINVIKVQGKTAYLSSTEDQFRRIYHDYSEPVSGFIKWKGDLESTLT